ncbi:2-oxoglutarate dehydrogenase E2 component [Candidatus Kryptonium thompsonii]|jgi:2-oxoglutarate dehydrogenase E2 component (dihydrolipoamide succinyltransferase)|uniref:Dihydrolipoamide acetyltransferase component of pyruvate dehydrogenase complex n=4 Tax=Candidatus Kryptonium thompsonii TaxID=1633631 RepID=A0A0P1MSP9_9BACT|nr:dihydrolipoamide acetyltransferase family protein [Candidatus Kryptonium thompsoni]CUS78843.1 2-oxoglutarate dehydrogenase E2 component [Candidatus Kryptonium thompsoni]CUS82381.1 2-oxoglutarate dehydrogenase E2 component [Candidatus Kryptonium thompsoni]CUS85842.1 2-oxoglutarate dehydrogenase E2 component [Candidatus Kryptonium thompsoni]CUS94247.1 2-oxoglutarate dehydrogenase E2 component [Candidatus Kryptonium thompsoni]CUS95062.1 2-oxoglutarate dehydrogenase E2 component [Candidatus Kry
MRVEVIMPKMGESLQEGTILKWHKKPGDRVQKDEILLEISTDKVDTEIPSPATGILTEILYKENETVSVGTVIAYIETEISKAEFEVEAKKEEKVEVRAISEEKESVKHFEEFVPETLPSRTKRFYSPVVREIAKREGISIEELEKIPGTGHGGRLTKNDILNYIESKKRKVEVKPSVPAVEIFEKVEEPLVKPEVYPEGRVEIVEMSRVIKAMAEHMVRSVRTSPHVAAISECDMTEIMNFINKNADEFQKREGFKLTLTPFVVDAVIKALKEFPMINSSVEGDKIIIKKYINIGIAVATDYGLIVPVVKNADEKNFIGLARAINDIVIRARNKKLTPDDIQGGTFSITNYGVFGNIIGTPIINQPQVAILGVGAVKKRPVVITKDGEDYIAIRSIAFLTLSFDHRIIDGALGGRFLERVVYYLENFDFKGII